MALGAVFEAPGFGQGRILFQTRGIGDGLSIGEFFTAKKLGHGLLHLFAAMGVGDGADGPDDLGDVSRGGVFSYEIGDFFFPRGIPWLTLFELDKENDLHVIPLGASHADAIFDVGKGFGLPIDFGRSDANPSGVEGGIASTVDDDA